MMSLPLSKGHKGQLLSELSREKTHHWNKRRGESTKVQFGNVLGQGNNDNYSFNNFSWAHLPGITLYLCNVIRFTLMNLNGLVWQRNGLHIRAF